MRYGVWKRLFVIVVPNKNIKINTIEITGFEIDFLYTFNFINSAKIANTPTKSNVSAKYKTNILLIIMLIHSKIPYNVIKLIPI
jgi:hypothetical protein